MATLTGVSPVLLVADIERSVAYYRDRLGFECDVHGDPPDFATARRDEAVLLLALCREPERIVPNWHIVDNMWNAYIRVDDADAVYAEVQERGAGIDYTIYDAPHGFREFGVQDPDGHDIAFGEPLQTVRIIAGEKRGAKIFAPKGHDTRPTSDRAREAAFNLIGPVDGATVLDLFAGSGAYGLEALSRGAGSAVFAESDPDACAAIRRNLEKLGFGATVLCRDAIQVLSEEARAGRRYDLVLADPPYRMFSSVQTGLATYLPPVLADDGLAVVETHAKEEPELPLAVRTSRRYGSARLTLFEHA